MSSVRALDIQHNAPSALALARSARGAPGGTDPWDPNAWEASGLEKLSGLSGLMAYWTPWFEAGRSPGEELRQSLLTRWPADSYEGELVARALERADELDHTRLVKEEASHLKAERSEASNPGDVAFYDLLLSCLRDLRKAARLKETGKSPAFVVHTDAIEKAQWTMHNLLRFLQAHWALRRVHGDIAGLIARRLAALGRLSGIVEGTEDMAESHDEVE